MDHPSISLLVSSTNILAETVLRINIVLMSRCHLTGFILVDPSPQRIPRSFGISDTDGICAIHVEKNCTPWDYHPQHKGSITLDSKRFIFICRFQ